jgi:hypothetical protein
MSDGLRKGKDEDETAEEAVEDADDSDDLKRRVVAPINV